MPSMSWPSRRERRIALESSRRVSTSIGGPGSREMRRKLIGGIVCGLICLSIPAAVRAAYTGTPPLLVVDGGTGQTSLTAFAVLVGAGTAGIVSVGPGATAGVPLISSGSSANPAFGTAVVAGGGTGQTTLSAFAVLLGNGTSGIASAAPSATSGVPLISSGSSANPAFGTAVVAGGGTGATTFTAHGSLVGEGTGAVVAMTPVADSVFVQGSATADPLVVGTSATADSVLAWTAAGTTPGPNAIPSCSTGSSALTYNTTTHVFGCNTISAGTGVALTTVATACTASFTVPTTNGLTQILNTGTACTTVNLPASQANGFRVCVKDGTENFTTNPATVKVSAGNIDGTVGTTGLVNFLNMAKQEACFISDGVNYFVE